ncbi:MAG: anti-sigma factor family protein [Oceanococcus sp.]
MHCQEVQILLPDLTRQALGPSADLLLQEHLSSCRSCSAIAQRESQLQQSLRALPVAGMPHGFGARALHQARIQGDQLERQSQLRHVGGRFAVAASVLMVCGLAFMLGRGTQNQTTEVAVSVPLGKTQMVALKIDAPQAFEHVQFEVTLPDNVALENQPDLREFAWAGQLQAGVNVLSLPLVGILSSGGQLVATVTYGNTTRSLNIPLRVLADEKGLKS